MYPGTGCHYSSAKGSTTRVLYGGGKYYLDLLSNVVVGRSDTSIWHIWFVAKVVTAVNSSSFFGESIRAQ